MIVYPELFKAGSSDHIEKPYLIDGVKAWQQCYICGLSISFTKDTGKWQRIGELIRHKLCEPPPYTGKKQEPA